MLDCLHSWHSFHNTDCTDFSFYKNTIYDVRFSTLTSPHYVHHIIYWQINFFIGFHLLIILIRWIQLTMRPLMKLLWLFLFPEAGYYILLTGRPFITPFSVSRASSVILVQCSTNWELVTLWVRSIPVDGEELKRIMEDHIFELRRKIWRSDMIDHRSMSSYLSPQFKYITFQILVHLSYSFIYSFVFFTFYGYITNSQCDQLPNFTTA